MEIVEYEFSTHLISIKHTKTPYHPICSEFAMPISDSRWRWYFRLLTGATLRENIFRLLPGGKNSNRKMLRMIKQQHELTWTMQGWYQSLLISATKWGNSGWGSQEKVEFRHALTVVVANPSSAAFYLWEFTERNRSPISGYLSPYEASFQHSRIRRHHQPCQPRWSFCAAGLTERFCAGWVGGPGPEEGYAAMGWIIMNNIE